jgi:hypothetical protein
LGSTDGGTDLTRKVDTDDPLQGEEGNSTEALDRSSRNLKKATIPRRLRLGLVALLTILAAAVAATPAGAIWWAPSPPTCITSARWINVGTSSNPKYYLYAYAYKYTTTTSSSRGIAYTTHYVYNVQNVFYPYG